MKHESKLRFTDEEQNPEDNAGAESVEAARDSADAGMRQMASHSRRTRQRWKAQGAERPRLSSNPVSRWQQRRAIRKQYAEAKHTGQAAEKTAENAAKAAKETAKLTKKATALIVRHRHGIIVIFLLFFLVALIGGMISSCSMLVEGGLATLGSTTYPCADADMLGAEAAYTAKEAALQSYLDNYESTHTYDEYHYDLDEIKHDPYVLISMLTAYQRGTWTLGEVEDVLTLFFEHQYTLTERVVRETRYDSDGEPYIYCICYVTLDNFDLSHLPVYLLDEEQLSMYASYMRTLGNRPDLFSITDYPNASQRIEYPRYEVPPEALADEQFAAMLHEAEKYLGYPYVWGGSNPSTSFDCSGFVSWVINHSGWNVGRLGAQALYNMCTPVSLANAKPGDLIFFTQTYDAQYTVSHVGIYVGNNKMLHCGNPIQYADVSSRYWTQHFYSCGRLPPSN